MATIAMGVIGAGVGALVTPVNPALGAKWGWSIGTVIGGLIDAPQYDVGRIFDRRISSSSYGTDLPRFWGACRLGGTVLWCASDKNGNQLIEHSHSTGMGGSGGGQTTYSYSVTFAVGFCQGTLYKRDPANPLGGSLVCRNPALVRLWADDLIVWERGTSGMRLTIGATSNGITWHAGAETGNQDGTIAAAMGSQTSGYPGLTYCVIENMDLAPYGNRIPNLTAELETDDCTLADVLGDLFGEAGLVASDLDLGAAASYVIKGSGVYRGVIIGDQSSPQTIGKNLAELLQFDLPEVDGVLRMVPRGGSTVTTLAYDDLGASSGKESGGRVRLQRDQASLTEMPARCELVYLDPHAHFQQAVVADSRSTLWPLRVERVTAPMALSDTDARQLIGQRIDTIWTESTTYKVSVLPQNLWLCPSDLVMLETESGLVRVRVADMGMAPIGEAKLSLVPDNPSILSPVSTSTAAKPTSAANPGVIPTVFATWSGKELRDADQSAPGFYVAGYGGAGWQGGTIYYSSDSGSTWISAGTITQASIFGISTTALAGGVAGAFDNTDTVTVDLSLTSGVLGSVSDAQAQAGVNAAVLGSEILAVGASTLNSDGTFTLSHLLRGLRGSSMAGHTASDPFVLVGNATTRVSVPVGLVGHSVLVKVLSNGQGLTDVTAQSVTIATPTPTAIATQVGQLVAPFFLSSPLTVLSSPVASVGWTAFDAAGAGVPASATHVILDAFGESNASNSAGTPVLQVRPSGGSPALYVLRGTTSASPNYGSDQASQLVCPLASGRFDYTVTSPGFNAALSLRVVGYWAPV